MSIKTIKLTDEQGNVLLPESALNNNGVIKFSDGTMIICKTVTKHYTLRATPVNGIFFGDALITLPDSFVGNYSVFGTSVYSTGYIISIGGKQNTSNVFACFVYDFVQRDVDYTITYLAIGRWK